MRRFYFLLIFPALVGGCFGEKKQENFNIENIEIPEANHEYFEVDKYNINWSDILKQNKQTYYVYIYSITCSHCQELKNWIIDQALNREDIFFVRATSNVPIVTDVSFTIGTEEIDKVAILGYPSLLKITENSVAKNIAGNSKIIELLS